MLKLPTLFAAVLVTALAGCSASTDSDSAKSLPASELLANCEKQLKDGDPVAQVRAEFAKHAEGYAPGSSEAQILKEAEETVVASVRDGTYCANTVARIMAQRAKEGR